MVRVEARLLDPEGRGEGVGRPAPGGKGRVQPVERGRIRAPKPGPRHEQLLRELPLLPGRERGRQGGSRPLPRHRRGEDERRGPVGFVGHPRPHGQAGAVRAEGARDEDAFACHVQRPRLDQPGVAVDARPLVEPAFELRGVGPHHQDVAAAVAGDVGHVVGEAGIAAGLAAEVVAVEPDHAVAVHAVELDRDAPAQVARRQVEAAAVPADGGGGKCPAQGLEAVVPVRPGVERQLLRPVVRKPHLLPRRVVEFRPGRPRGDAGLGEEGTGIARAAGVGAEVEVGVDVGSMAEGEAPAGIEREALARGLGGGPGGKEQRRGGGQEGAQGGRRAHGADGVESWSGAAGLRGTSGTRGGSPEGGIAISRRGASAAPTDRGITVTL